MSGLSPACVFRSAGTCHRFGFLPVGRAARLGVAGRDVTGQGTCRPVGTDLAYPTNSGHRDRAFPTGAVDAKSMSEPIDMPPPTSATSPPSFG
jgi:hypothetical protein